MSQFRLKADHAINWEKSDDLRAHVRTLFAPVQHDHTTFALCVEFVMTLVHKEHPADLDRAKLLAENHATVWLTHWLPLALEAERKMTGRVADAPASNTSVMTVAVPTDGDWTGTAEQLLHVGKKS